jgi:hypothetical protein
MVTIGLAVSTFIFYKKAQESIKEAEASASKLEEVTGYRKKAGDENLKLKEFMGHPADEDIAQVEAQFKKDMLAFQTSVPEEQRNYNTLPIHLLTVLRDKSAEVADAREQINKLLAERDAIRKQEQARVVKVREDFAVAKADFDGVRVKYVADVDRITGDQRKLRTNLEAARKEMTTVSEEKEKEINSLAQELAKVEKTREALVEKVNERKTETFEEPDGKVTWVNQRDRLVWINLGRGDNLGRQVNFSVHEKGTSNVTSSARKGSIEVVRILDNHLAEARIVDDSDTQPILPGDLVYSPTWTAGRQMRFALAGFMDIDGDGKSDRNEVRNLITSSSGVIDADVDEKGDRSGRLSINTRYLVLGDRPTEKTATEAIQAYTAIQKEAYDLGVEKISLEKLLDMMGYEGTVRAVTLGRHARSEDFKAAPESGVNRTSTGNTSEIFKKRSPRSAY